MNEKTNRLLIFFIFVLGLLSWYLNKGRDLFITGIIFSLVFLFVLNFFFSFIAKLAPDTTDISLLWKIAYWVIFLIGTLVLVYLLYVFLENNMQVSLLLDDIVNLVLLLFIVGSLGGFFHNNVFIKYHISLIFSFILVLLTIGMSTINTDGVAGVFVLYFIVLGGVPCLTLGFYYGKACRWITS